jgi:cell division protein FtsZ
MMGTAVAEGPDRARIAAEQAVACPLLDGIDLSGAKGVLVLISAGKGKLKLSESKLAMNTIRAYAAADAHVIYGTAYDDSLGEQVRVTVVATGLSRQGQRRPPMTVIRTGTDNGPVGYAPATPGLGSTLGSALGAMPSVPTLGSPVAGLSASAGGLSAAASALGSLSPASSLSADVNVPSVWRNNRTTAAAKVDALAAGGMDDLEIPAFLRRQAD